MHSRPWKAVHQRVKILKMRSMNTSPAFLGMLLLDNPHYRPQAGMPFLLRGQLLGVWRIVK